MLALFRQVSTPNAAPWAPTTCVTRRPLSERPRSFELTPWTRPGPLATTTLSARVPARPRRDPSTADHPSRRRSRSLSAGTSHRGHRQASGQPVMPAVSAPVVALREDDRRAGASEAGSGWPRCRARWRLPSIRRGLQEPHEPRQEERDVRHVGHQHQDCGHHQPRPEHASRHLDDAPLGDAGGYE